VESFFQGETLLEAGGAIFYFFDDIRFFGDELSQVAADETETSHLNGLIVFLALFYLAHKIMHAYSKISQEIFFSVVRLFFRLTKFT
jgi:hypothetical protein